MPVDAHGLHIVDSNEADARLKYYRFRTNEIEWPLPYPGPGVNVLLPTGFDSAKSYPVLYLFHGGLEDFTTFDVKKNIRNLTAGASIIIVMPDGGLAGWYSNPVHSNVGRRNWENFHIKQLIPWIDRNFNTHANKAGRAVAGFSMGGFGALKYAKKHPDMFASASAYSGPASLRADHGLVTHWANISSATVDLGGGSIYGVPLWDEAKVDADDPSKDVTCYQNTRIFLVSGDTPDQRQPFDLINETVVRDTQNFFVGRLDAQNIQYHFHPLPGGHVFRPKEFDIDLKDLISNCLTPAS